MSKHTEDKRLKDIHDTVVGLRITVKHTWQAVMGLYAIWGSIVVGVVVAHAYSSK